MRRCDPRPSGTRSGDSTCAWAPAPSLVRSASSAARRATSRANCAGVGDSSPVCSWTMMSHVPPVSIAATGTPSAPASSRTRLSDSGPCEGKTSSFASGHPAPAPASRGSHPVTVNAHAGRARPRLRGTPADCRRRPPPAATAIAPRRAPERGDARPCWARACPTNTAYGSVAWAWVHGGGRASMASVSTGLGMTSSRVPASSGARARRSRAMAALTAITASARARAARLRARLRAHVRNQRQRERPGRAGARAHAARHHRRASTPGRGDRRRRSWIRSAQ